MKVHGAKDRNTVTFLEGKHVENTGGYKDMGTKRQDIRTLSKRHPKLETLMNRVDKESLIRQHRLQKKDKAPGIDMVTKEVYQENLNENIDDLMHRLKSFSYKPQPVRRVEIDKGNGKKRPLGIPVYEDRLFQGAMADILSDVYEPRFLDCSYGFRPNRKAHDAIKVINAMTITTGTNTPLTLSAKRAIGAFELPASSTSRMILAKVISSPTFSASN